MRHSDGRISALDRQALAQRLRERYAEIEQDALTRVHAVSDPREVEDPAYGAGLEAAVGVALEYAIDGIEAGDLGQNPIPDALLVQARVAARNQIGLDTVLCRYFAGYTLFSDFLIQEVEDYDAVSSEQLKQLLRVEATILNRLVGAVAAEYGRVSESRRGGDEQRRIQRVRMLLAGELVDAADLAYELDAIHIGLVGSGPDAQMAIRGLAAALDRRLLIVCGEEGLLWAWLGGRTKIAASEVLRLIASDRSGQSVLAVGEAGEGVRGWRLTHRQANAAMSVACREGRRHARYADVALVATALRDEVLAKSLYDLYLAPLKEERDGGVALCETLDAYFASGHRVSSTAAALKVSRQTVGGRLRRVEERIGCPLNTCTAEVEMALRVHRASNGKAI
jgi:hypothetical protein